MSPPAIRANSCDNTIQLIFSKLVFNDFTVTIFYFLFVKPTTNSDTSPLSLVLDDTIHKLAQCAFPIQ